MDSCCIPGRALQNEPLIAKSGIDHQTAENGAPKGEKVYRCERPKDGHSVALQPAVQPVSGLGVLGNDFVPRATANRCTNSYENVQSELVHS